MLPSHERDILPGSGRALDGDTCPGCPPNYTLPGPWGWASSWQGAREPPREEAQPWISRVLWSYPSISSPIYLSFSTQTLRQLQAIRQSPRLLVPWREGTDRRTSSCSGWVPAPIALPALRAAVSK